MSSRHRSADPSWVHRSVLSSVGVWIWLVGFAFVMHGGWTFWRASERAERDVRMVRESRVERIRMDGRVYSQGEVVTILKRRPYWAALPYGLMALLMGLCASVSGRKPILGAVAALTICVVGSAVVLARLERFDYVLLMTHLFLVGLLALGVRSAVGYVRALRESRASGP